MPTRYFLPFVLLGTILLTLPAAAQSQIERLDRWTSIAPQSEPSTNNAEPDPRGFAMTPEAFAQRTGLELHTAEFAAVQTWLIHRQQQQVWDQDANGGEGDWQDEVRVTYTRDDQGHQTELLYEEWDVEAGEWIPSLLQSWQRDENGRILESLYEEWDPEANAGEGAYQPLQRTTNSYNDQGNTLVSTTEFWDEDADDYFIWSQRTRTYDASGEVLLQELTESGLFGPLQPSFRYSYTYDDGRVSELLTENFNSTAQDWVNYRFETRAYDGNGAMIERAFQNWDDDAGEWVNRDRTLDTYDPDSVNPTEIVTIDQNWDPDADGGSGAWMNEDREIATFDVGSNTATNLEQVWDPEANGGEGDWLNVERLSVEYTSSGDLNTFLYEEWSAETSTWEPTERGSAEFDENGLTTIQLSEVWDGAMWVNDMRSLFSYQAFDVTAAEHEQPGEQFRLDANYPNPFQATTTIRYTLAAPEHVKLEVFDVLGRRVSTLVNATQAKGVYEVTLDARDFAGGLYVYRLSGDHHQASRTMLLVR